MHESEQDLAGMQALMDRSFAAAGPHLLEIAKPERRLNARQVAAYYQGQKHVVLATVSSKGLPLAGALDAFFIRGRFYVSTGAESVRLKHLRRNPNVSLVHLAGDDLGITVHGRAVVIRPGDSGSEEIHQTMTAWYKSDPTTWGEIAFIRIEPRTMHTFAMHPENYPESPAGAA